MPMFKWRSEQKQELMIKVATDYLAGITIKEIAYKYKLSIRTIYRYLRIVKEKNLV